MNKNSAQGIVNTKLLAIALMVAGATAACDRESIDTTINVLRGEPDVAATPEEEHVNETQETEHVPPVMLIQEPKPLNEHEQWQTDPAYVCTVEFRKKSCTDWGEPVWLDEQMGWLPFGVVQGRTE